MRRTDARPVLLPHGCEEFLVAWEYLQGTLVYVPFARELLVQGRDGTRWALEHCPFCGARWPESLREEYFDRFDRYPADEDADGWWRDDPAHADVAAIPALMREVSHPRRVRPLTDAEVGLVNAVVAGLPDGTDIAPVLPRQIAVVRLDRIDAEVRQTVEPHRPGAGLTGWVVGEVRGDPRDPLAAVRVVDGVVTRFWCVGWDLSSAEEAPRGWSSGWDPEGFDPFAPDDDEDEP